MPHAVSTLRRIAPAALCALATAWSPLMPAQPVASQQTPNILFVIIDDIGVDQMRVFGYQLDNQAHLPVIDSIATAGVRFRNAWAMPECSPSRVSFFTGRYPFRTDVLNISTDQTLANSQMSTFEMTAPDVLRARGYTSGFFGKWHHTSFPSNDQDGNPNPGYPFGNSTPRALGWDYFEGMLEGAPRAIDSTAGGVAPEDTYSCGFVNDASFGACYLVDGSCSVLGDPAAPAGATAGRQCLESGGILVPGESCQAQVPPQVDFTRYNGYYVAPMLINHEDGQVELVAGFEEDGTRKFPTDPRARRYLTTQQTDAAVDWIRRQDGPWMATLSYSVAHLPAQQPPRHLSSGPDDLGSAACGMTVEQRALTNRMLEAMDRELGRLLVEIGLATVAADGTLDYRPEETDTMLVIVGDNGSYLQTVRLPFDFTRAKATVYQTGVWVPLFAAGPLVHPDNVGAEVPHLVNAAVDVFALFGEVAGLDVREEVPPFLTLDSQPLMPYLTTPGHPSIRHTNFAHTGTVLEAPGPQLPCVLTMGGLNICTELFTNEALCRTEGGTPYPDQTSCCAVQQNVDSSVELLPYASWAIRDDEYKLVRIQNENCQVGGFDIDYEFYRVDEAVPVPALDTAAANLLQAPTLPPQGLQPLERIRFYDLMSRMDTLLASEGDCPGDGNKDGVVDAQDMDDWQYFADRCSANPNQCSSFYDFNLDGVTDEADRMIIESNLGVVCPFRYPKPEPMITAGS